MTPEQALEILNQAAAKALLTRENHYICQQAVDVLGSLLKKPKKEDK